MFSTLRKRANVSFRHEGEEFHHVFQGPGLFEIFLLANSPRAGAGKSLSPLPLGVAMWPRDELYRSRSLANRVAQVRARCGRATPISGHERHFQAAISVRVPKLWLAKFGWNSNRMCNVICQFSNRTMDFEP